ncbi:MAG TPA: hypothetical protein VF018_03455 [Acidobacteriaceae bacterium]
MYPECRHVLTSGNPCNAPALATSNWCYFHSRLYQRQGERQAARHTHRRPDGRFAALPAPDGNPTETIDYGPYPVSAAKPGAPYLAEMRENNPPLDLPPVEDTASIQLALIDVLQALAANQLDPKRAGLLLYGLQVASSNAAKMRLSIGAVRTVTYTEEGTALAPQDYGYDVEDYEAEHDEEDEEVEDEYEEAD